MLIIKRGYRRKYQIGGCGIFSKLEDILSKFISKKQVVDTALNIAKSAGQKAGQKAIELVSSKLTPKSQQILSKLATPQVATTVPSTPSLTNLNNLIVGTGSVKAIKILDLVRRLNN